MKVKALFILTFLTFSQQIFSQKNMVLGYIIKQNGDSIKGKIDDGFWSKNPAKINFSTNDTDIKTYDAVKELQGFGINEKSVYVRKKIAIDITPYENSSLLETSERIIVSDTTLMLKHLVKGKINLYFLRDNKGKPHFFVEKLGSSLAELIKHDYIKVVGSRKIIVKEKLYNNQLSELFKDNSIYENEVYIVLFFNYLYGNNILNIYKFYNSFFVIDSLDNAFVF